MKVSLGMITAFVLILLTPPYAKGKPPHPDPGEKLSARVAVLEAQVAVMQDALAEAMESIAETAPVSVKADGQRIGRLVDQDPRGTKYGSKTWLVLSDAEYLFEVGSRGEVLIYEGDVLFDSMNCTGRWYPNEGAPQGQGIVMNFQKKTDEPGLYYIAKDAQLVDFSMQSLYIAQEDRCMNSPWLFSVPEMLPNDPTITAVPNTPYPVPLVLGY